MPAALSRGTVIGGVTVGEPLGRGGFGITYRAEDNRNQRSYALKEYFPVEFARRHRAGSVEPRPGREQSFTAGLAAFLDEANTLRRLPRQRGLVRVRGAFERFGTAYCLMEFIEGEPLNRVISGYVRNQRPFPEDLLVEFVGSLTSALTAVHGEGLIHRDIKPANVMIRGSNGEPVLIDFGAARHVTKTESGASMLTREYAPIEQFPLDWQRLGVTLRQGPWSDIYALSVMLYRMMADRLPADAETRMLGLHGRKDDPYESVSRAVTDAGHGQTYSRRLCDLVDYGCNLFPSDRPADAAAFGALIGASQPRDAGPLKTHAFFGAAEEVTDVEALQRAVGDRAARSGRPVPSRRNRGRKFAAALALAAGGGLAWAWSQGVIP